MSRLSFSPCRLGVKKLVPFETEQQQAFFSLMEAVDGSESGNSHNNKSNAKRRADSQPKLAAEAEQIGLAFDLLFVYTALQVRGDLSSERQK